MRPLSVAWFLCLVASSNAFFFDPVLILGFGFPSYSVTTSGKAHCVTGNVQVTVNATNEHILMPDPANQLALTEIFTEYLQVNSSMSSELNGGPKFIEGTYNINAKLCYPMLAVSGSQFTTIEFLIHGIGYDKSYWDLAPGYSYVDAAADAGYATFSYDRLGVGASDHPDPIDVVQASLEVEVAHALIQSLRDGVIGGNRFHKVVGVGHSLGSIQSVGLAVRYPQDLDAMILQGFSINIQALGLTLADWSSAMACQNSPGRFGSLPGGYMVTEGPINNQLAFFRYPNFDSSMFTAIDSRKQTYTIGELFTLTSVIAPAVNFTGPVDVVLGKNNFIFCQGDCTYPVDQSSVVRDAIFPSSSSGSQNYLVDGTGHAINAHYGAQKAFAQMINFIKANGIVP